MVEARCQFGRWFFGYRPAEVDDFLRGLVSNHQQELARLHHALDGVAGDHGRTVARLNALEAELAPYEVRRPMLLRAVEQARRSALQMEEGARYRAERILAAAEGELASHRNHLALIKTQLQEFRAEFQQVIGAAEEFIRRADRRQEEQDAGKVAGRILAGGGKGETLVARGADGLLWIDMSARKIAVRSQSGQELGTVSRLLVNGESGETVGYELGGSLVPERLPNRTIIPTSEVRAMRTDGLIVTNTVVQEQAQQPPAVSPREPAASLPPTVVLPEEIKSGAEDLPPATPLAKGRPAPPEHHPAFDQGTVALRLQQTHLRYVVGNLAGRDLFDERGGLIIAKGELITEGAVEQARGSGKLPELIVHMVLPGMEAEGDPGSEEKIS